MFQERFSTIAAQLGDKVSKNSKWELEKKKKKVKDSHTNTHTKNCQSVTHNIARQ